MNAISRLVSGCTIMLILKENVLAADDVCRVSKPDGKLFYNCSNLPTTGGTPVAIPENIDPAVTDLDLSGNTFREMKEDSFKKFTNLVRLSIRSASVESFVDNYLFRPLTKLEEIDISGTKFKPAAVFFWPPNIKILNVGNTGKDDVNAADLIYLEIVDARDNKMNQFPHFNLRSPLHTVNLDGNMLNALTAEQLAPYCQIKNLSINVPSDSDLLTPPKYCDCLRLNLWVVEFGITANTLECQAKTGDVCEKEFNDDTLRKRRECLGMRTSSYTFLLILLVIFLSLLTLIALIIAYRYANLRRHTRPLSSGESLDEEGGLEAEETAV